MIVLWDNLTCVIISGPPLAPAGVYVDKESVTTQSVRLVWSMTAEMGHGGSVTSYDVEAETNFHPGDWTIVASGKNKHICLIKFL